MPVRTVAAIFLLVLLQPHRRVRYLLGWPFARRPLLAVPVVILKGVTIGKEELCLGDVVPGFASVTSLWRR